MNNKSSSNQGIQQGFPFSQATVFDENGQEKPITRQMIEEAVQRLVIRRLGHQQEN